MNILSAETWIDRVGVRIQGLKGELYRPQDILGGGVGGLR